MLNKILVVIGLGLVVLLFFVSRGPVSEEKPLAIATFPSQQPPQKINPQQTAPEPRRPLPPSAPVSLHDQEIPSQRVFTMTPAKDSADLPIVNFQVDEDGLATVDEDIVLGEPLPGSPTRGKTTLSELNQWPNGRVPYFIQGDFERPERVKEALEKFVDTPIQLIPYAGQEDVLVFQNANNGCKSYLGKMGGKQPIFISSACGSVEIAHEIMHALGFVHEQNRTDREAFVTIHWDNIQDKAKINFEMFPPVLMKVSGTGAFDFKSLMIYSPNSFSRNGAETLSPKDNRNEIAPEPNLSSGDHLRLQKAYGGSPP